MKVWMKLNVYPEQATPCADPRGCEGWAMPYSGEAILTAANNDTIHCLVNGIEGLTLPPWWLEGSLQITDGTGRFEGVKGYMTFTGLDADTITFGTAGSVPSF